MMTKKSEMAEWILDFFRRANVNAGEIILFRNVQNKLYELNPKERDLFVPVTSELIENGYLYIDKTAYLKDLVSSGTKVLFMLRPRRFGKTLTMSMIHYFLEMNYRNPDDYSFR